MKTLQNNFTTPEQSKRLLELGVPADSADMYYDHYKNLEVRLYSKLENTFFETYTRFTPCWSVGRLIEISNLCFTSLVEMEYYIKQGDCNTDYLVKLFEISVDNMDFSKLEN